MAGTEAVRSAGRIEFGAADGVRLQESVAAVGVSRAVLGARPTSGSCRSILRRHLTSTWQADARALHHEGAMRAAGSVRAAQTTMGPPLVTTEVGTGQWYQG